MELHAGYETSIQITLVVFFFYMLFFDQNDIISLMQLKAELSELEQNKTYYKEQIEITKNDLKEPLDE